MGTSCDKVKNKWVASGRDLADMRANLAPTSPELAAWCPPVWYRSIIRVRTHLTTATRKMRELIPRTKTISARRRRCFAFKGQGRDTGKRYILYIHYILMCGFYVMVNSWAANAATNSYFSYVDKPLYIHYLSPGSGYNLDAIIVLDLTIFVVSQDECVVVSVGFHCETY